MSSSADGTLETIVQALRAASNLGAISANDIEETTADLRRSPRKMDDENANLLSESVVNSFAVPIRIEDEDYLEVARLLATNAYANRRIIGIGIASRGNTDTAVIKLVLTFDGSGGEFIYFGRQRSEPWRILTSANVYW